MRLTKICLFALVLMLCACPPLFAQTGNGSVSLSASDATSLGGILGILLAVDRLATWWKNRNNPTPTPTPVPTPTPTPAPSPNDPLLAEVANLILSVKQLIDLFRNGGSSPVQMMGPPFDPSQFKAQYDEKGQLKGYAKI
jgi:hypothetical protein